MGTSAPNCPNIMTNLKKEDLPTRGYAGEGRGEWCSHPERQRQKGRQNGRRNKYLNEENLFAAANKFYITVLHISKFNIYL